MSKQFKAAIIDGIIFLLLSTPIIAWALIVRNHYNTNTRSWTPVINEDVDAIIDLLSIILTLLLMVVIILKDAIGISIGKNKYRLKIIDRKSRIEISTAKKIIRNIPLLLFPFVEFPMKLLFPKAKLGDMILDSEITEKTNPNSN